MLLWFQCFPLVNMSYLYKRKIPKDPDWETFRTGLQNTPDSLLLFSTAGACSTTPLDWSHTESQCILLVRTTLNHYNAIKFWEYFVIFHIWTIHQDWDCVTFSPLTVIKYWNAIAFELCFSGFCISNFALSIIQCLNVYFHNFCHVYFYTEQCCLLFYNTCLFFVGLFSKTLRLRTYTKQIRNNVWHRQHNFRYCQKKVWLIVYCLPSRWRVFDWAFPIAAVTRGLGLYGLIRRPAPYSACS